MRRDEQRTRVVRAGPIMIVERRIVGAVVLQLANVLELYASAGPSVASLAVCFVIVLATGLLLRAWWALLLACVPWPPQIALGLATGRYLFLGEGWEAAAASSVLCGLFGTALGVILARWRLNASHATPSGRS